MAEVLDHAKIITMVIRTFLKRFWSQLRGNQRGQVALFIALIFQVLFVFFAMMINVGLLVHHKINLQNSVDLAAYYGAMKQAETLNVIAHTNYQIRQSWKLLNFRTRQLGGYGASQGAQTFPGRVLGQSPPADQFSNLAPGFCIVYPLFNTVANTGDYCKASGTWGNGNNVSLEFQHPTAPVTNNPLLALVSVLDPGIAAFFGSIAAAFNSVSNTLQASCSVATEINYFTLGRFVYAYKRDISTRKRLILSLASNMSRSDANGPLDIDGQPYKTGIQQTLLKNLTYQNKTGLTEIKFYNSLSNSRCSAPTTGNLGYSRPFWISEINVYPYYYALLSECPGNQTTLSITEIHADGTPQVQYSLNPTKDTQNGPKYAAANKFFHDNTEEEGVPSYYNTSIGFEKNPWCPAFVGVEAQAKPEIPFSPFGSITLKATAYAKPFGGTIGPWYAKSWPSPTSAISGTDAADVAMNLPRWLPPANPSPEIPFPSQGAMIDYPRYVGDGIGSRSSLTEWAFGEAITSYFGNKNPPIMSLGWWTGLADNNDLIEKPGTSGDILAYSSTDSNSQMMRELEVAAISPDQYDVSYYSIEPDFYDNYLTRLTASSAYSTLGQMQGVPLRGDLGSRMNDSTLKKFSVLDQISTLQKSKLYPFVTSSANYYVQNTGNFREYLTGFKNWVSATTPTPLSQIFGKCSTPLSVPSSPGVATTGMCNGGGRVGYSVKLVDQDVVQSSAQLSGVGGAGTSGQILNGTSGPDDGGWMTVPLH